MCVRSCGCAFVVTAAFGAFAGNRMSVRLEARLFALLSSAAADGFSPPFRSPRGRVNGTAGLVAGRP